MLLQTELTNYPFFRTILNLAVVHESVSLVVSRQVLTELCSYIPNMESMSAKNVSHFILDKLQPRAISFEEQVILRA